MPGGKVGSYEVCIASTETEIAQKQAFDNFVADMRNNVAPDYISDIKRPPNDNDLEIYVPGADMLISINRRDYPGVVNGESRKYIVYLRFR